jgi:hypothetical protein
VFDDAEPDGAHGLDRFTQSAKATDAKRADPTGVDVTGVASTGVSTGVASTGVSTGVASTGVDVTGVASTGVDVTGVASTGVDVTGVAAATGVTAIEAADDAEFPAGLVATALNVYGVPLVKLENDAEKVALFVDTMIPPGEDVTVYPVIADPPLLLGAVHVTPTLPSPAVADAPVGASGTFDTVTAADAAEGPEFPTVLVATTVKV